MHIHRQCGVCVKKSDKWRHDIILETVMDPVRENGREIIVKTSFLDCSFEYICIRIVLGALKTGSEKQAYGCERKMINP